MNFQKFFHQPGIIILHYMVATPYISFSDKTYTGIERLYIGLVTSS